jgi:hypothetical protein
VSKIFVNYVNGAFKYDAIALMPFNWLILNRNRQNLLYIFKLIRLKRGFENLEVMDYLKMYKQRVAKSIERKIKKQKNSKKFNEDDMLTEDQTRLGDILKCNLLLKLIQILIVLASTSFFFAMTFRFIMQIESDVSNWDKYNIDLDIAGLEKPEHFLEYY